MFTLYSVQDRWSLGTRPSDVGVTKDFCERLRMCRHCLRWETANAGECMIVAHWTEDDD
jgi:hypothetical protein